MDGKSNIDKIALSKLSMFIGDELELRTVDFYFYFPTEYDATLAEVELINMQFSCYVNKCGYSKKWSCIASKEIELSGDRLSNIREWMEQLAAKYNGAFDGWGMEV